ncbi:MAG: ligase 1 [Streptosporangiaceae bacterium]|jgi:DNA ligase-1|nr:ligase 1 [Streptosporangiaceae bacterium]
MRGVLLSDLVRTSEAVSLASGRRVKIDEIAGLLRRAAPDEISVAVAFLSGELRQRQIGVGYAALGGLLRAPAPAAPGPAGTDPAAAGPATSGPAVTDPPATGMAGTGAHGPDAAAGTLTLAGTDSVFAAIGATVGPGSQAERRRLLGILFGRATPAERSFLTRLLAGELHQGALEGVMIEAVARAAGVDAGEVRRAHLLGGSLPAVAEAALSAASAAREDEAARDDAAAVAALAALRAFRLEVGRPLRPMLAASAPDVVTAFERMSPAAVEWKIDGIRIQVHRQGPEVRVFTRTLDDITARLPEITRAVLASPAQDLVLDGEAIALGPGGRARPFQVTASRAGTQAAPGQEGPDVPLTPFFFDLLHLDGRDLIDEPATVRHALMSEVLPADLRVPRLVTGDVAEAEAFFADAVGRGHEGVVMKSLDAPYAAGRRGGEWIKVKPRHTLDLVVLAAEWGHGRRRGWLSNLHLGARDPAGGFVMLGKTFKGLTDEMLRWQTGRFLDIAEPPGQRPGGDLADARGVLGVRPEMVVEIAFDGVQASPRYPGGLALRFARVLRYRPDKQAAEADTIDAVRAIWDGRVSGG